MDIMEVLKILANSLDKETFMAVVNALGGALYDQLHENPA